MNEIGKEEIVLEHDQTFFQWIFRQSTTKETYIKDGVCWFEKGTGIWAGVKKEYEICKVTSY